MSLIGLLSAFFVTLQMVVIVLIGASLLGIPVAWARMARFKVIQFIAAAFIGIIRGIPTLAWLFIVFFSVTIAGWTPGALFSAIITLVVVNSAYFAENYRAGFEAVPSGYKEASAALGLSGWDRTRLVTAPLALKVIVGSSSSIAIQIVKETSVASLIGAQELTYYANAHVAAGGNGMFYFSVIGVFYLALSLVLGIFARRNTNTESTPATI
ncbi:amino acid ABC transporter permease [Nesterenkonia ebinurensis]|uniref:amino acid ABC transporter permease n=1 Tax=Nesterenkonia ebinurensis TaxID=2608252 RepID=UPI00123D9044|nr:ABC transporter permease subunit [Nesterenkonia ebinurensis]